MKRALVVLAACSSGTPAAPHVPADRYSAVVDAITHADTVEQLIPTLPADLRRELTFVYATRSPQQDVDPMHPRVVLFGRDARIVLAFTGDPQGPDRDIVELIRFRDDTRAFEMARYILPAARRRDPALAKLAAENGRPNPTECLRCHGADPRPIFDSYPVWPGFYGSTQDAFAIAPDELAHYRAFLAARTGVYALLEYPAGSEVPPYSVDVVEDATGRLAPNMRLGMALTELNRQRIVRKLEASPRYAMYRDKLITGLIGCAPLPITLDDRKRIQAQLDAENAAKLDRAGIDGPDQRDRLRMTEINSFDNFAQIEFVARVLDVSRADWSMAIEPGAFALYDGILSGHVIDHGQPRDFYFKEDFLFEMLRRAPEAKALFAAVPYTIGQRVGQRLDIPRAIAGCEQLATERGVDQVPWPAPQPAAPLVVYRCVRCHDPGGDGPEIPFDSPARLHVLLGARPDLVTEIAARTTLDAPVRMPLDQTPLPRPQRAELLGYIDAVK